MKLKPVFKEEYKRRHHELWPEVKELLAKNGISDYIAEGKIRVRPLKVYHGKVGHGLSVEMPVKHGPVTLLSVAEQPGGKLMLLIAEGNSVNGPILQISNTNSCYKFPCGARNFVNNWNSYGLAHHHCAVGTGKISSKIKKLGMLLNLDVVQVC